MNNCNRPTDDDDVASEDSSAIRANASGLTSSLVFFIVFLLVVFGAAISVSVGGYCLWKFLLLLLWMLELVLLLLTLLLDLDRFRKSLHDRDIFFGGSCRSSGVVACLWLAPTMTLVDEDAPLFLILRLRASRSIIIMYSQSARVAL